MSRARILTLLVLLLAAAILYAWWATPRQRSIANSGQRAQRPAATGKPEQGATVLPAVADLDFKHSPAPAYRPPQKNLFGPLYLPPKPVKPKPVVHRPPPPRMTPPPPQVITRPIQPVRPDPFPALKVLGFLKKGNDFTVFLADRDDKIFLVGPGETFGPELQVAAIDGKRIVLKRLSTGQTQVLPLGEAKSQRIPDVKFQSGRPGFEVPADPEVDPRRPTQPPGQPAGQEPPVAPAQPEETNQPGLMLVPGGAMN